MARMLLSMAHIHAKPLIRYYLPDTDSTPGGRDVEVMHRLLVFEFVRCTVSDEASKDCG